MPDLRQNRDYLLATTFILSVLVPIFTIDRTETLWLLSCYCLACICYLLLWNSKNTRLLFWTGMIARLGLFLTLPILSDDIFRFLWDGFLMKNGLSPFAQVPNFYLVQNLSGNSEELYALLNSKNYFTVYPPTNQAVFWLAVSLSNDWLIATGVIRVVLLASDIGTYILLNKILKRKGWNTNLSFLYFLNPLVILEGVGNTHFETIVIFFLALMIHLFEKQSTKAGIAYGLAIGVKLLPLIYLPFLFLKGLWEREWKFIASSLFVMAVLLFPIISASLDGGVSSSFLLYFKNFAFNPSIFLVLQETSIAMTGHTQIQTIGPVLAVVTLVFIFFLSLWSLKKEWHNEKTFLFTLTIYLLLSTTVHPWYILPLILFGILGGYVYPILWSLMIFLTYAGYSHSGYNLHWFWTFLEYLVVLLAFIFNDQLKKWLTIS